jgi:hypothetical protein
VSGGGTSSEDAPPEKAIRDLLAEGVYLMDGFDELPTLVEEWVTEVNYVLGTSTEDAPQ